MLRAQRSSVLVLFLGFMALFFVCAPHFTSAALLYIDPPDASIYRGDTMTVGVRIDTDEEECINTVDAVLEYDPSIRAVDVSRGDSILSIWLEDPVIDEENHTITFAGGIPGGYCGRIPGDPRLTNIIAEVVFRSPGFSIGGGGNPTAEVKFSDSSQVLLHDGFGTNAPLRTRGIIFTLLDSAGSATEDAWTDRVAADNQQPADFAITLSKDDTAFSQKYFITFNTIDKQSGIDHYEVMEEPFEDFFLFKWGAADAPWISAKSPYVLKDQTLNSTIRVKAIDKAGNERIAFLVPETALRSYSIERVFAMGALVVIVVLLVGLGGYALWRRKQQLISTYESDKQQTTED